MLLLFRVTFGTSTIRYAYGSNASRIQEQIQKEKDNVSAFDLSIRIMRKDVEQEQEWIDRLQRNLSVIKTEKARCKLQCINHRDMDRTERMINFDLMKRQNSNSERKKRIDELQMKLQLSIENLRKLESAFANRNIHK